MAILTDSESFHQHQIWDVLVHQFVDDHGFVNYKGFKNNETEVDEYLNLLTQNPPQSNWAISQKLAYWINAYNAFTVKLIMNNYGIGDIRAIGLANQQSPFKISFFKIGEEDFTLDKLEHEILRKEFDEPRIHFCLVCASFSCPNLRNEAYTEAKLEQQLTAAAKSFINDKTKNTITTNKIEISKIFDWFSGDFKKKGSVIDFLNQYSTVKISSKAKINYKDYNWSLNE